jgi:competence protein ComEC
LPALSTTSMSRSVVVWLLIALLCGAVFVVWRSVLAESGAGVLSVSFLDVGQGDAILIETPSGTQALIDGGNGRAVLRALGRELSFFDRTIDLIIATHPDADHIGGLPEVLKRYRVDAYLESGVADDGADYAALIDALRGEGLAVVQARAGTVLALDDEVYLHVLFPDREVTNLEPNSASVIVRLVYRDTSFLFMGDAPTGIEEYLTELWGSTLESDVLKLGHHGSRTSTSIALLGFVAPEIAVISAGCDNRYGHPHRDVLERLERFQVSYVETCKEGTVRFVSDGAQVRKQ